MIFLPRYEFCEKDVCVSFRGCMHYVSAYVPSFLGYRSYCARLVSFIRLSRVHSWGCHDRVSPDSCSLVVVSGAVFTFSSSSTLSGMYISSMSWEPDSLVITILSNTGCGSFTTSLSVAEKVAGNSLSVDENDALVMFSVLICGATDSAPLLSKNL